VESHGFNLEISLGAQEMGEQAHDLDVRHGARRGHERCAFADLRGQNGGLELRRGGAVVENVGEMHTWIKIRR